MNFKVGDVVQVTKDYPNGSTAIKGEKYFIGELDDYSDEEAILHHYNKSESGCIDALYVRLRYLTKGNIVPILTF